MDENKLDSLHNDLSANFLEYMQNNQDQTYIDTLIEITAVALNALNKTALSVFAATRYVEQTVDGGSFSDVKEEMLASVNEDLALFKSTLNEIAEERHKHIVDNLMKTIEKAYGDK